MSVHVVDLSPEDKRRLRTADARREVAGSGHPELSVSQATGWVEDYMELLEEFHRTYDLDPEGIHEFDASRGSVFKSFE